MKWGYSYPYTPSDGRESPPAAYNECCRTLRGGSWNDDEASGHTSGAPTATTSPRTPAASPSASAARGPVSGTQPARSAVTAGWSPDVRSCGAYRHASSCCSIFSELLPLCRSSFRSQVRIVLRLNRGAHPGRVPSPTRAPGARSPRGARVTRGPSAVRFPDPNERGIANERGVSR